MLDDSYAKKRAFYSAHTNTLTKLYRLLSHHNSSFLRLSGSLGGTRFISLGLMLVKKTTFRFSIELRIIKYYEHTFHHPDQIAYYPHHSATWCSFAHTFY